MISHFNDYKLKEEARVQGNENHQGDPMVDQKSHIVNWECCKIMQDFYQAETKIYRGKDPFQSGNLCRLKQNDLEKLGQEFLKQGQQFQIVIFGRKQTICWKDTAIIHCCQS